MLKSLTLTADSMPISGLGYEDIARQSTMGEVFHAGGRTAFRESYLNTVTMEMAIDSQVQDYLQSHPDIMEQYRSAQSARPGSFMISRGGDAARPDVNPEDFLPKYSRAEFEEMGFTVNDKMEFGTDGKLSLPRFSIMTEAYEANVADAETMAMGAPGIGSWAAGLAGGLAYSLADPINVIPFGMGINKAKTAYQTMKTGRAGIMAGALAEGAVSGMVGTAVVDAVSFPMANEWGADLGWKDALVDIVASGVLGAFFGAVGGFAGMHSYNKLAKSDQGAVLKAMIAMEDGRPADVEAALSPLVGEARAKLEANLADPEYVAGLHQAETRRINEDAEVFKQQLAEMEAGTLRTSGKFSRAPSGPDGPRLIIGESPAVFRMLDGVSFLEVSPELVRRFGLDDELRGLDPAGLPEALSRPAAVFEMSDGRQAALIGLKGEDGRQVAAVVELKSGVREYYPPKKKKDGDGGAAPEAASPAKISDNFIEIDDINIISNQGLASVGQARRLATEGRLAYADAGRISEISGLPADLADLSFYSRPEVRGPDELTRHLAMEDLGIDLDSPMFGRVDPAKLAAKEAEVTAQGRALLARAAEDPNRVMAAQEAEINLMENELEAAAGRGELTEAEMKYLRKGDGGTGEDAVLSRQAEADEVTKAQAMLDATDCVIRSA